MKSKRKSQVGQTSADIYDDKRGVVTTSIFINGVEYEYEKNRRSGGDRVPRMTQCGTAGHYIVLASFAVPETGHRASNPDMYP